MNTMAASTWLIFLLGSAAADSSPWADGKAFLQQNGEDPEVTVLKSGLQYKVLKSGALGGKQPTASSPCVVSSHASPPSLVERE